MRSNELNLSAYDTDKTKLGYLETYDSVLAPWINKDVKLLEVGVHRGGSLKLWRDYFPRGTIVGIDRKLPEDDFGPQGWIQLFEGRQQDPAFLSRVANSTAPEGFDIIIDDASHVGDVTKVTFWHLFEHHLKPGGLYAIEDWGNGISGRLARRSKVRPANPNSASYSASASGTSKKADKSRFPLSRLRDGWFC